MNQTRPKPSRLDVQNAVESTKYGSPRAPNRWGTPVIEGPGP